MECEPRCRSRSWLLKLRAHPPSRVFALNVRLPGQYYDLETGLHYNYFRTYDPATGRYLEADPIGQAGGLNPYGYALNSPLSFGDPLGLDVWIEVPAGGEPSFHQSVNVGDPLGAYDSYSFGMNGNGLEGEVYRDTEKGGEIEKYKSTTPAEDAAIKAALDAKVGNKATYGVDDICRSWSQGEYKAAPGTEGAAPPRAPVPQLPGAVGPLPSRSTTGTVSSTSGSSSRPSGTGTSR